MELPESGPDLQGGRSERQLQTLQEEGTHAVLNNGFTHSILRLSRWNLPSTCRCAVQEASPFGLEATQV